MLSLIGDLGISPSWILKNSPLGGALAYTAYIYKGWLAIAKLKPLSLFISLNIIALESI